MRSENERYLEWECRVIYIYFCNNSGCCCHCGSISLNDKLSTEQEQVHFQTVSNIEFKNIRPVFGNQNKGFEEFVCQLARRSPPVNNAEFQRIEGAGGDGGIEACHVLPSGGKISYQAKYWLKSSDIKWGQIDKSVTTALRNHPDLKEYIIVIPCDLTGTTGRTGKSGWERWKKHKEKWEKQADEHNLSVKFKIWTTSEIYSMTADPAYAGLLWYWFDQTAFNEDWFKEKFQIAKNDLGERYLPNDHVNVSSSKIFDALLRNKNFIRRALSDWHEEVHQKYTRWFWILKQYDVSLSEKIQTFLKKIESSKKVSILTPLDLDKIFLAANDLALCIFELCRSQEQNDAHGLIELGSALTHYSDDITSQHIKAEATRFAIIDGEAGIGKSHLIADAVQRRVDEKLPAIMLLGQHFVSGNLEDAIRNKLDLPERSIEQILDALNAAAEMQKTRCLICIDALNEAKDLKIWRNELASFVQNILRRPYLALAVSLRTEFKKVILPDNFETEATKITFQGFDSLEEQNAAASQFIDESGIIRPATPFLAPEFRNPLFLITCCKSIQTAGQNTFPLGMNGAMTILAHYLDWLEQRICQSHPNVSLPHGFLKKSFEKIAHQMAKDAVNYISDEKCRDILSENLGSSGPMTGTNWASIISEEGALRRDLLQNRTASSFNVSDVIYRFTYERFSDHLIAAALLDPSDNIEQLIDSDSFFMRYLRTIPKNLSVISALSIQIPEKYQGQEFFVIYSENANSEVNINSVLVEEFYKSLKWRSTEAFSDLTWELFDCLATNEYKDSRLEVMIHCSVIPDHPMNADFLHEKLLNKSMPDRDVLWTDKISHIDVDEKTYSTNILIDWAQTDSVNRADRQTLRLSAITLSWLLSTTNQLLRDKATKSLSHIFMSNPALFTDLLPQFSNVNDLYVLERFIAAGYGIACHLHEPDSGVVRQMAQSVYDNVFSSGNPPLHLLLRDYAQGIIERAKYLDCLPTSIDISKCKPPFNSPWPLKKFSDEDIHELANTAGDDRILNSCVTTHGNNLLEYGDFGRYTLQYRVSDFTNIPLADTQPSETSEENRFDVGLAGNWVTWRAYGYGWKKDLFPNDFRYSPRYPKIERIGKKYQWLALYDILCRLADHVWLMEPGQKAIRIRNAADLEFSRNIDPTILPALHIPDKTTPALCWVQRPFENIPPNDTPHKWAKVKDAKWPYADLINISHNKSDWLSLRANYHWHEGYTEPKETPLSLPFLRQTWARLFSFLVKENDLERALNLLKEKSLIDPIIWDGLDDQGYERKQYFLMETPWRIPNLSLIDLEWILTSSFNGNFFHGIKYAWTTERLTGSIDSGTDLAIEHGGHCDVLAPWFWKKWDLAANISKDTGYTLKRKPDEEAIFKASLYHRDNNCIVQKNAFVELLKRKNLACIWIVTGERIGFVTERTSHSNIYWLDEDVMQESTFSIRETR